ncbi:MAG: hypothetical protein ACQESR_20310 [Planctomycetota bacterium]
MTKNAAASPPARSLREYAWRVLAPREFAINVLINGLIAWWVYSHADRVTLLGWSSVLVMCGPISFILPTLTTFFGRMNGVVARGRRKAGLPWPENGRWQAMAWVAGLGNSAIVGPAAVMILLLLDYILPGLTLAKWTAIALVACYSGLLGFVLHGRAVLQVERLHAQGLR